MKLNVQAYVVLGVVFALSFGAFLAVPDSREVLGGIVVAPGVTALLAALFQLMRDQAEYEKRLAAQRREFQFALGAASHMANVAFDKHAEFCEAYMQELHAAVGTLYREGDTPAALDHAAQLSGVRQKYSVWLTDSISTKLGEFEVTLRRLGASSQFIRSTTGNAAHAEQRLRKIDDNFDLFACILGLKNNEGITEESMVEDLERKVRAILGVEELTRLREHLVKQAHSAIGA